MKFSSLFATAIAASSALVSAYKEDPVGGVNTINFFVDYSIKELPEVQATDVADIHNTETVSLFYTAKNDEDFPVLIIGVGGSVNHPVTGDIVSNFTVGQLGPITLGPGESESFEQKVSVNLVPGNYVINPQLYVAIDEQVRLIPIRGQVVTVTDFPISFFNPQLLFLELILIASFGGLIYFGYESYGKQYFAGTSPVAAAKIKKASSPSISTGAAKLDESWLPESHLKQKKAKKAN
ncbi:uncharacterized protein RJT21DRAFT_137562 [Scheffersomyces amazonensis]|uniref:uncharacterized protein n=1 Tax=Scheffersomyces amazonensis TaxID=1078765 RepID=UPI00315DC067